MRIYDHASLFLEFCQDNTEYKLGIPTFEIQFPNLNIYVTTVTVLNPK